MKKHEALSNPKSCLNKAGDDEPIFILRANDPTAAQTIRHWVTMNIFRTKEKRDEALKVANDMEDWRAANVPAVVADTLHHHV